MARLDRREDRDEGRRPGEDEDCLRAAPAGVGSFDEAEYEQDERARDGERAGRVVAPRRDRRPAIAQEHGAERERSEADGNVDEEDPLPAGAVDERAAYQVPGGGPEGAVHAPDRQRLVALGPVPEGGRDDRERGGRHDRRPDALERTGADQGSGGPGEPAEQRGAREEQQPDHEHAA